VPDAVRAVTGRNGQGLACGAAQVPSPTTLDDLVRTLLLGAGGTT
jgi:hypothetical protein